MGEFWGEINVVVDMIKLYHIHVCNFNNIFEITAHQEVVILTLYKPG